MFIITGILGGILTGFSTWCTMKNLPLPPEKEKLKIPLWVAFVVLGIIAGGVIPNRTELWSTWIRLLFILTVLAITVYTDFRNYKIPNPCVAALLIGFPICTVLDCVAVGQFSFGLFIGGIVAFAIAFAFLVLFRRLSHNGIGYGDIKLVSSLAAILGLYGTIFVLFIGELAALLCAGILILRKKLTMKGRVPFAPFCYIGYIISLILGTF